MSNTNHESFGESSEISWQLESTTVYGTLVKPNSTEPFPAVVMVAGSGPTDRNWNSPLMAGTNGSAGLIAEALGQDKIASLRYDKRASGPHAQENMKALFGKLSMQTHLDELSGAVHTLADLDYVRNDKIFGLGDSEGTLHVLNYQIQNPEPPFAGIVLIGPPGRAVGDVARTQLAEQAAAIPNGDALLDLYDESIVHFLAGEPVLPNPALPEGVQQIIQSLINPANLPFARELWKADAGSLLRQIDVPVLIVIGKKDIQVDWKIDSYALQSAAKEKENVTFLFPENANHVLKHESRPRQELTASDVVPGYNSADGILDPEALNSIKEWLATQI